MPAYLSLPGTSGNYLSTPDAASLHVTGDIDIRIKFALVDVAGGGVQALLSRYQTTVANRSFTTAIDNTGKPKIAWYEADGTAQSKTASTALAAGDGEATVLRITIDVDDGASGADVTFYENGVQLGTVQTVGSTTDIRAGSADLYFGGIFNGATVDIFEGDVYYAELRDGIDGDVVARLDADDWVGI